MSSKSLINMCNYLGYVSVVLGILLAIYVFDLNYFLDLKEIEKQANFSEESKYFQSYVDEKSKLMIDNILKTAGVFAVSLLIGISLWFKANMLRNTEIVEVEEGDGTVEEEIENEDAEEAGM